MRIVITHTDFRLYWPARLSALSRFLDSLGHTLHIVEIAGKGSPYAFAESSKNIGVLNCICLFPDEKIENISPHSASIALWEQLEDLQPDVVIAGAIAFPSGATAVRWCRSRNKKVIIFDNARPEDVPRSFFVNFLKRRIYRNVDAMLVPAQSHAEAYTFWSIPLEKMFYGLNVVDNEWFAAQASLYRDKKKELQVELGLKNSFILGVGRLVPKKNWHRVLLAYAKCRNEFGNAAPGFVIIGDGPEREYLNKLIAENNIKDVMILPFVSQEDLCKYYSLASALILASNYGETWGLVVNEAMASGLPVLVSEECGCASTLVQHGKNGYVFPAENIDAISQTLLQFNRLPAAEQQAMGKYSKNIIRDWSLDRFCKGAMEAIRYAEESPLHYPSLFDSIVLRLWKGRYRPT